MKLCSQSEGTLPWQMTAAAKSRIMEAPMSLAARIISTTMPDGLGALPAFIYEIAFLTITMVLIKIHISIARIKRKITLSNLTPWPLFSFPQYN